MVAFTARFDDDQPLAQRGSGSLRVARVELGNRIVRIHEKSDRIGLRKKLTQQLESLRHEHLAQGGNSGDVSSRSVEAADEAEPDWVATGIKNDRYRRSHRFGGDCCGNAGRDQHCHRNADQLRSERG
jgi:hypothetical protein